MHSCINICLDIHVFPLRGDHPATPVTAHGHLAAENLGIAVHCAYT